jgi:uncharacterized protein (TIGR04255 family)
MGDHPLPDFRKPPVIETVLSVEFAPIKDWALPHFGLFWAQLREHFPRFEVHPPIRSEIESFEPPQAPAEPEIRIELAMPEGRCWYVNDDGRQLLQIQNGRFIFNWRKRAPDDEYPRYRQFVLPSFNRLWQSFLGFLKQEGLGEPSPVQCEVTYVNHIPKGEGWNTVEDWDEVFNFLNFHHKLNFLPHPEATNIDLAFVIPEKRGRLRAKIRRAIRIVDKCEIITLNLIARGRPQSSSTQDIVNWFELGHEWVVRGFADITTPKMHEQWERVT